MKEMIMNEIWKNVVNLEDYYEVSNLGNVRSKTREGRTNFGLRTYGGNLLRKINHNNGYCVVNLTTKDSRKQCLVHILVIEAFIGKKPDGMECCHNNGNRKDNRLENLRWDTRKNNHADKLLHGTWQQGEKIGTSKLKEWQAKEVKYSSIPLKELSKKFNVSMGCVEKIRYSQSWKYL
jgi:hypothetical protein